MIIVILKHKFQGLNEKTIKAIEARNDMQNKMSAPGYEFDADDITEQFSIIVDASCEDIIRQRQRLGGDWTVRKVTEVLK